MTKVDPNATVTNQTLGDAVEAILEGVDRMFKEERKFNVQTFATKDELRSTKDELKNEIVWLKNDVKGLTEEFSDSPSKREFNQLKVKVDKYFAV